MELKSRLSPDANITVTSRGWQLTIPSGPANRYRLSQLDDQLGLPRRAYPWHAPTAIGLRLRASAENLPGTWGFGLWNDPFGCSFGFDKFLRLPALPNAIWFFHASSKSYLSFRDDRPAQGFLAQSFNSPAFDPAVILAGLALPFSRKESRRLMSRVVEEDAATVSVDVTRWHTYRLEWSPNRSVFWVDEARVFESRVSPRPPLGLVLWIDNQYAAFTPQGKLRWGLEEHPESAWLEIEDVEIQS